MNTSNYITAASLAAIAYTAMIHGADAQSLFGQPNYRSNSYETQLTIARMLMMVIPTGFGFVLGWFLSSQAAELRRTIVIGGGVVLFLIGLSSNGFAGWGATMIIGMTGFFVALGYWVGKGVRALAEVPSTFGSAKWADVEHLRKKNLLGGDGLILGEVFTGRSYELVTYKGDRHGLSVAPTRSGKGVSHIVPNLLVYEGSALVIDPKGENAIITGKAREEMGQDVRQVDPFGIATKASGRAPARFNPMDWIKLGDDEATENAMLLADALVQPSTHNESFWTDESKAFLQGLILMVAFHEAYADRRNLGTVRDLLLLGADEMEELFQQMAASPHHIIASSGARSLQKEPKLMANVLASAQAETHMLDSQKLRDSMAVSDFSFEDLKTKPMTIYVILPADRLVTFSRFLRLMIQQAITVNARNIDVQPKKPVLFILDEMPALGRLAMVEQAYGLMAGFGIQLWGITQDLCQLRRVYGENYESFIANSGAVAYFGSPDKTSSEYFSAMCGVTTVWNFSSALATALSSSSGNNGGSSSRSMTETDNRAASQRKLAYADELMRLPQDQQLILIENANPIMARKRRWFDVPELAAKGVNTHRG